MGTGFGAAGATAGLAATTAGFSARCGSADETPAQPARVAASARQQAGTAAARRNGERLAEWGMAVMDLVDDDAAGPGPFTYRINPKRNVTFFV
jgi:hypothetical protein